MIHPHLFCFGLAAVVLAAASAIPVDAARAAEGTMAIDLRASAPGPR